MAEPKPYHHGDLRQALLIAAEAELASRGIEAFSLRQVAKRAGVSHAAPAHHFNDTNGLLTALAAEGYRHFLAQQHNREAKADRDPRSQMIAAGLGYVDFALARPALFGLLFNSQRPDYGDDDLRRSADAAYNHLCDQVIAAGGRGPLDLAAVWGAAHGIASLMTSGQMPSLVALPQEDRDRAITAIIVRSLPRGPLPPKPPGQSGLTDGSDFPTT